MNLTPFNDSRSPINWAEWEKQRVGMITRLRAIANKHDTSHKSKPNDDVFDLRRIADALEHPTRLPPGASQ